MALFVQGFTKFRSHIIVSFISWIFVIMNDFYFLDILRKYILLMSQWLINRFIELFPYIRQFYVYTFLLVKVPLKEILPFYKVCKCSSHCKHYWMTILLMHIKQLLNSFLYTFVQFSTQVKYAWKYYFNMYSLEIL